MMPDKGDDAGTWEAMDRETRKLAILSVVWCGVYAAASSIVLVLLWPT
jgi:hypothetical protein